MTITIKELIYYAQEEYNLYGNPHDSTTWYWAETPLHKSTHEHLGTAQQIYELSTPYTDVETDIQYYHSLPSELYNEWLYNEWLEEKYELLTILSDFMYNKQVRDVRESCVDIEKRLYIASEEIENDEYHLIMLDAMCWISKAKRIYNIPDDWDISEE